MGSLGFAAIFGAGSEASDFVFQLFRDESHF
jgi:hypothetical protein